MNPVTAQDRLYDLAVEFEAIEALLDEAEGDLTPEIEERLNAVEMAFETKMENVAKIIRISTARAEMLHAEAKRLVERGIVFAKKADRLKWYALTCLQIRGTRKLKAGLFDIAIQRNSQPSISCTIEPKELPAPFRREIVSYDVDREAVKRTPASELPDCIVVQHGSHLRIR